jgi:hypothetical protein
MFSVGDPPRDPMPTPPPTPAPMQTVKKTAISAQKRLVRVGLGSALMGVSSSGRRPGAESMTTCRSCAIGTATAAVSRSGREGSSIREAVSADLSSLCHRA